MARLLIVDENELNRDLLSRRLIRRGHDAVGADGATNARALLSRDDFDAVLLDVKLPRDDGWALLAELRLADPTHRVPVVAFAARPSEADVARAGRAGCDACLAKPLDLPTLFSTLDQLLRERGVALPDHAVAAPPPRPADEPPQLLVVDDEAINREMLERRLIRRGFGVRSRASGPEALATLVEERIDLVLLDIMMPGMTGLEVLRRIREVHSAAALPVIMATAQAESMQIVTALETGANDYVTKPLDFPVVLARVQAQLGLRAANEAARSSDAHFRHLAETSADLITRQTPTGTFLYVSPAAHALLGYDPNELVGTESHALVHDEDFADFSARFAVDEGTPGDLSVRCRLRRKDGTYAWFEVVYRLLRDPQSGDLKEMQVTYRNVSGQVREHEDALERVLTHLAQVTEARVATPDPHVLRVAKCAELLALKYGQGVQRADLIRRATMFHDFGNVVVPPRWLQRPGPLSDEERAVVRTHTTVGHDLLRGSGNEVLELAAIIALNHHERDDGTGYPRGRRGRSIPLEARLVAISDVYDALRSPRPWRAAHTAAEAWEVVRAGSGSQFDAGLVDLFGSVLVEIESLRASVPDRS